MEADSARVWTIGSLVRWAAEDFRARGIQSPRLDAELLVAHALGIERLQVIVDSARELADGELATLRSLVKRRRAHEPVAYLRGEREFYGLVFRVDKRVLVPRPDTEILVEVALRRSAHVSMSLRLLDVCTGSGCVAVAIARERPTACVFATDLSADALAVARGNAMRLGSHGITFVQGDLFASIERRFDVVTANPPYIPTDEISSLDADVRAYEPRLALDGGVDGLRIAARIIADAPTMLVSGGCLALEVGAGQAAQTAEIFAERGFGDVRLDRDYAGIDRVVSGTYRHEASP